MSNNTEKILTSIIEILNHIKEVEADVVELSKESMINISNFLSKNSIEADASVIEALQHQDIISQQLSATTEAINSVEKNINIYLHALREDTGIISNGLDKLHNKLSKSLDEAKSKKSAFAGKSLNNSEQEEIEFF